jgi:hypothetical protein
LPVAPTRSERQAGVPSQARAVETVWSDVDQAWTTICALLVGAELVAFRENDRRASIEASVERVAAHRAGGLVDRRPFVGTCPPAGNVESIGTLAAY